MGILHQARDVNRNPPNSIGTISKAMLGNFWQMGWSTFGLFWALRYHLELNWTEHNTPLLKSGWVILHLHLWQHVQCLHGSHRCGERTAQATFSPKPLGERQVFKNCGMLTNRLHNTTQQNTVSLTLTLLVLRPLDHFSWSICSTVLKKMHLLL